MNYAIEILKQAEYSLRWQLDTIVGVKASDEAESKLADICQAIADLEAAEMVRQMRRGAADD
jgi:hypothetical protein